MADRTSAALFGEFFELCARINDDTARLIARESWLMIRNYDFSPCQMECDDALRTLGIDPDVRL